MAVKSKARKYSGILRQPIAWHPPVAPPGVDPDCPPDVKVPESWGGSKNWPDLWRRTVLECQRRDAEAELEVREQSKARLLALCKHYGVELGGKGWAIELALSLALRHEKEFVDGRGRVRWRQLCEHEGVDPDNPVHLGGLVLRLASRWVPGFQLQQPPRRPDTRQLIDIFTAIAAIADHLERSGQLVSAHAVATILLDKKEIRKALSKQAADNIEDVMKACGNKKKSGKSPMMSERTLRNYASVFLRPLSGHDDNLKNIRERFLLEVLPVTMRLEMSADDWQIGPPKF